MGGTRAFAGAGAAAGAFAGAIASRARAARAAAFVARAAGASARDGGASGSAGAAVAGGALGAGAAAAGGAEGAGAGAGTMSSSENRRGAGHEGACFALAFNSAAAGDAGSTSSLMGDGGGLFCGFGLSALRKVQGPSYPLKAASRFI